MNVARTEERRDFDVPTRLRLVEHDADKVDEKFDKIDERFEKFDGRLGKIMATCVSILVALCVSCVLLVINLAVK